LVPADVEAGYYDATVTNPDSQSGTLTNGYTATNPIPIVTDVTPALSPVSTSNLHVTITGSYFRTAGAPGVLRASLDGTSLANVTYVSQTELSAEVPFSSPGLGLGGYLLTVVNPGPTDPSGSLPDAFTVYTYTTTCDPAPLCNSAVEEPDGGYTSLDTTDVITIDFGAGEGITDGSGYDMVFYEREFFGGEVFLDFITIELSDDRVTWHTVFNWDGVPGGVAGTNIDGYATDPGGEEDNESIPPDNLYPGGLATNTGIAIDIGAMGLSGPYRWVRISNPGGGADSSEVDAILRLH
jgi:hypothetical protein